jgi:aerobic-type carbon monoxide dehydrogenase small subunit (CoxS/CutS family)
MTEVTLTLNGRERQTSVPEGATLAELLREQVGLTGTKIACAEGTCGACTVLVDGRAVLSCIVRAEQAEGCDVTTIEGLGDEGALSALQRAFVEEDALQCGFCTAGQIVSATALLASTPRPTSEQVRAAMSGNLCRCGAYANIVSAILDVAKDAARRPA